MSIVDAAATMIYSHGVAGTTLDDVLDASGTGKSQLYHYFSDKSDLVNAVITRQLERVIAAQPLLDHLDTIDDIDRWAQAVISSHAQPGGPFSCPLGSLAAELKNDPAFVPALDSAFQQWAEPLRRALSAMIERRELDPSVNARDAAAMLIAALQGGMLLARIAGNVAPLRDVLTASVESLRSRCI